MPYAIVKRYETDTTEFADWEYRLSSYDKIYEKMMELTNGDHETSADAAGWCELASPGEIYEFTGGEIEIQIID